MIGPSESVSGSLTLIYQLANGKFLIIDGGVILADRIYKELRELQPNTKKYTIAGWFISHPHSDHQDGIEYFIEQHGHEVDIENIYFNYANASYYNDLTSKDHQDPSSREGPRVTRLRELVSTKLTRSTKIVKPHTGQIYSFGSATVEILSTVEDILPTKLPHINEASMVIRATVAGQTTMLLGDASSKMKSVIRDMYDTHVKSDILTLAHHGVWDTTPELYKEIKGKVLLWPNNTAGARMYYTDKSTSSEARRSIQAALDQATDVFLAKGTDIKLDLPYTPVNNKESFINSTLK
jgi:beta-lactamase superfamily II metal-dependent hydrolase